MKKRRPVFLLFACSVCFAFADTYDEVPGSGLFITSVPSGAKVFVDGVERGTTPYSISSIRSGEYNIRVEKEGYVERRFRVVIRRDSRVEVSVDLEEAKGQVLLNIRRDTSVATATVVTGTASASLEFDPRISVDGSRLPSPDFITSPVYEQNVSLPVGWRTITVEAFGWERISTRILVEEGSVQKLELVLKPAAFTLTNAALRKKRFNPQDSGILGNAEINFLVSGPGSGILEVLDAKGEVIFSGALRPFTVWQQQALWNGRTSSGEPVNDGHYTLRINAWKDDKTEQQSVELSVQVDSSITMRPLGIASSTAGLLLVPVPEALPAFSYQIDGSIMAGKPLLRKAWKSLPFAIGLRVSFLDNLEAALVFNALPEFSGDNEWGVGASLKWVFFRPLNSKDTDAGFTDALGMAAVLSYGWATNGPYTAFGMGTGAGLRLPVLYRLLQGNTKTASLYSFDLLLSPLVLWASEKGYPDSSVPRLGIEGGALFSYGSIAAGLSVRWDYAPKAEKSNSKGPVVSALEFKFSPSSFVLSVSGGFWYLPDAKESGAFFGIGLGIMY